MEKIDSFLFECANEWKCYFSHLIFSPFEFQKKKDPPLLSMWSNSSTPLRLAAGGHGTCGIHKSNFVRSVCSTKVTDATKGKEKRERIPEKNLTEAVIFFHIFIV
jgi:hypothetical protein